MAFQRAFSGSPWEKKIGYCRVVKAGNMAFVTGTAPVGPDGKTWKPGDPYAQTQRCLQIIQENLAKLGVPMTAVVRTRMYVTDVSRWQEYGQAHGEVFSEHPPATTIVEISRLIEPDMMIEIEADAVME